MHHTVIKHSGHLRTLEKCRKHSPAARVFYISLVFSNACSVLSQCNTRLRLLYLLNSHKNLWSNCSLNYPTERSSFLEYPSQPFEKETGYTNQALYLTSSTANILRIIFNSVRVSFFKSVYTCLQKEKKNASSLFFSK